MRRIVVLVLLLTTSCGAAAIQAQMRVASAAGLAINTGVPLLIDRYKADGLAIIAAAPDREAAELRLAAHRAAWASVWGQCRVDPPECSGGALNSVRAAHDAWAAVLESANVGQPVTAAHLLERARLLGEAYCELRGSLPEETRSLLPNVPLAPCGASGGAR